MDLQGLEDDPDFWNMNVDDESEINLPVRDLTKTPSKHVLDDG